MPKYIIKNNCYPPKRICIQTFEEVITKVITNFSINIEQVDLFNSATLYITFFNDSDDNVAIKADRIILRGDEYKNWGNNDEYLINYVANYYGFTLTPSDETTSS